MNRLKFLSQKRVVVGLPKISAMNFCEGCILGKQSINSFPSGQSWRASNVLELLHVDLCGPMKTESLGGSKYLLLLTDDCCQWSWVYFLKFKSDPLKLLRSLRY